MPSPSQLLWRVFHEGTRSLCPRKANSDTAGAETAILGTAASWIADVGAVASSSSGREGKNDLVTLEVRAFGSVIQTRCHKQISFASPQRRAAWLQ